MKICKLFICVILSFWVGSTMTLMAQSGDQILDGIGETGLIARYLFDGDVKDWSRNNLHAKIEDSKVKFINDDLFGKVLSLPVNGKAFVTIPGEAITGEESLSISGWIYLRSEQRAQIDAMDQGIGKIIDHLKRNNLLDDTIILFLSDNGGCAETFDSSTEWVRRYGPKTTLEGAEVTYGNDTDLMAGTPDTYMSYGKPWANLSNTPFRYYKHYGHEGGVATPFIVHWPKGFSEKNKFRDEVASIIDIMPTILDITNTPYPLNYRGTAIQPMEGESLLPVFAGNHLTRKDWFMEHQKNKAVRSGKWKLVATANGDWELYDMEKDRTETNNIRDRYPDMAKNLEEKWNTWAWRTKVLPRPTD